LILIYSLCTSSFAANGFGGEYKRQGAGKANWGRPGDEMVEVDLDEYDPAYDSAEELYDRAFGVPAPKNFDWSTMTEFSEEDHAAMSEIDAALEAEWMRQHQIEQADIEDEGKAFFAFEVKSFIIDSSFRNQCMNF
jgi:hypothetical protein